MKHIAEIIKTIPTAPRAAQPLPVQWAGGLWGAKAHVFEMVLMSVAKAFADMNVKDISHADRDYLVNELTDNIMKRYPSIRVSEIPDAIADGIRGRFGEFYGLSVVTFERFIEQYLHTDKHQQLVKELPPPVQAPVPDTQTRFITAKNNALQALERKKTGKDIAAMAPHVYNFLNQLQLLPFTGAEKYEMLAEAAKELIAELQLKLSVALAHERRALKHRVQTYHDALAGNALPPAEYIRVTNCAKKIALDAFLQGLILNDDDLDGMIEENRGLFLGDDEE